MEENESEARWAPRIIAAGVWSIVGLVTLGMTLPSIGSRPTGRRTESRSELVRLETAIASFKARYGVEPPGFIELAENPGNSSGQETRRQLRKIWPKFDFQTVQDLNDDGDTTDVFQLSGAECLVFFLAGRVVKQDEGYLLIGFDKSPTLPFAMSRTHRDTFYEFRQDQLVDVDDDGFLEYVDSLPDQKTPLLYTGPLSENRFSESALQVFGPGSRRNLSSIYLKEDGTPWKADSYQIISPGEDGKYGVGGVYSPGQQFADARTVECDNITNFCEGVTLVRPPKQRSWFLLITIPAAFCVVVVLVCWRLKNRPTDVVGIE